MSLVTDFENWLVKKLESLEIEDEILGSYISSIVTSDDPYSEKKSMLKDILLGFTEQNLDVENISSELLDKWSECLVKPAASEEPKTKDDVALKVAMIMEKQAQSVSKVVSRSSDEERLRQAILTSSTLVDSEVEDCESGEEEATSLAQNQNVETVLQAEKEKREKMKAEAEKKKAQDKANLEKQRQKQEEKKKKGSKVDTEKKGKTMKKGSRR